MALITETAQTRGQAIDLVMNHGKTAEQLMIDLGRFKDSFVALIETIAAE
jgi:hypothetical protein